MIGADWGTIRPVPVTLTPLASPPVAQLAWPDALAVDATAVRVLTVIAAVVVLVTWWRLGTTRAGVGQPLVWAYAGAGICATAAWSLFLVLADDTPLGGSLFGVIALGLWWLTGVLAVSISTRLIRVAARHNPGRHADATGRTPGRLARWIGVVAHLVLVVAICAFTYAYITKVV